MGRGNRSKHIGTSQGETPATKYAQLNGFPEADRIQLRGTQDASDIRLCHNVVLQMKVRAGYSVLIPPLAWLEQATQQAMRFGADIGFLLVRPSGMGDTRIGMWHAWMWAKDLAGLYARSPNVLIDDAPAIPVRLPYIDALRLLAHVGYGAEERDRAAGKLAA